MRNEIRDINLNFSRCSCFWESLREGERGGWERGRRKEKVLPSSLFSPFRTILNNTFASDFLFAMQPVVVCTNALV